MLIVSIYEQESASEGYQACLSVSASVSVLVFLECSIVIINLRMLMAAGDGGSDDIH
jgi:hypothetical protein